MIRPRPAGWSHAFGQWITLHFWNQGDVNLRLSRGDGDLASAKAWFAYYATPDPEREHPEPEQVYAALARAIEAGYADGSVDGDMYINDPVYHAVVYEARMSRGNYRRVTIENSQTNEEAFGFEPRW